MTRVRIVRTGDGYRRESVDTADSWREARYLLSEYRLSDPGGLYEAILWRRTCERRGIDHGE